MACTCLRESTPPMHIQIQIIITESDFILNYENTQKYFEFTIRKKSDHCVNILKDQ